MRPSRLYIKIFFSFLLVLAITEVLIFGFFLYTAERSLNHRVDQYLSAYAVLAREIVEGSIKSKPKAEPAENESLKKTLIHLSHTFEAKVWLAAQDGTLLLKSFQTEIPGTLSRMETRSFKEVKGVKLFHDFRRGYSYHAVIPIEFSQGETGSLHFLFEKSEKEHLRGSFALGLFGIGGIIALLTIPVSRLITKRITQLRMSALKIADGDLLYRANVKGKDEIGELGHTFNLMADKLEKMIRAGKELTAHISHELRSPLTRIRVAEELLREKLTKGNSYNAEGNLNDIREDVEEMDQLIGRILELSKLDLHEKPMKFEFFNPLELMEDLIERFRPILSQKDLHLIKNISYNSSFYGDKEALRTGLSNILDNATKFVPEKGHLIVNMHFEDPSLFISVTNSFQAIPTEDLSRIFEPFNRTERSPATGYGLGLAITKKIIEKHGGHIEAFNAIEGLEIRIRLPKGQVTSS